MRFYRNGKYAGFSREEFACKCGCGFSTVDAELLAVNIDIKKHFGNAVVIINSGCRCEAHNRAVGGAENSTHVRAIGADIIVSGVNSYKVYDYVDKKFSDKYGVGKYNGRTHIDVRAKKARWDCTNDR